MKKRKVILFFAALGGLISILFVYRCKANKSLQEQPPLYLLKCSQEKHGLYQVDANLVGSRALTLKEYDLFAGVDYKRDTGKFLSYALNEGIIEYAYSAKKQENLLLYEEIEQIEEQLKSAKKGIFQLTDVQYMQNLNQISFVYGKWGSRGEGNLYSYNQVSKEIQEICSLSTQGSYCWMEAENRLYFINNETLLCRNLITGEESEVLSPAINFAMSPKEEYIAIWREKKFEHGRTYDLYLWDKVNGKEEHIVNVPFWGRIAFSPDGNYVAYLAETSGILGSILNGTKPVLSIYDIKRKSIIKQKRGNYQDVWADVSW